MSLLFSPQFELGFDNLLGMGLLGYLSRYHISPSHTTPHFPHQLHIARYNKDNDLILGDNMGSNMRSYNGEINEGKNEDRTRSKTRILTGRSTRRSTTRGKGGALILCK